MTDNPKIDIPERHQAFCEAAAKLAREYGLEKFSGAFTPGFKDEWGGDISFTWEQGRHGEDSDRIFIASQIRVHTKIGSSVVS